MKCRFAHSHVAFALVLLSSSAASGQTERVISGRSACETCELEWEQVISIGEPDGPGSIGRPQSVAKTDNFIAVVSQESRASVRVFNMAGEFVRAVGGPGGGPSEFGLVAQVAAGAGDTIYVNDSGNARVATVDLASGDVVDTNSMGATATSMEYLGNGRLVVAAPVLTPEGSGFPLHFVGVPRGRIESFGTEDPVLRRDMFYDMQRYLGRSPNGGVYAARYLQLLIEEFTERGELVARWVRAAAWMPPQFTQRQMTDEIPEHPKMVDQWTDSRGRTWVAIRVNPPTWFEGLGEPIQTMDGPAWPIEDPNIVFGSRVEVLDLENAELLVSTETDETVVAFLGDNLVATYEESREGLPRLLIWRLSLSR